MKHGFLKVRCISPDTKVADTLFNARSIINEIEKSAKSDIGVLVLPELAVTGASCGDLFLQDTLINAGEHAIEKIRASSKGCETLIVVGAPIKGEAGLYNCAVVISNGKILGVVPKTCISSAEARCFSTPCGEESIKIASSTYPFGNDLVFNCGELKIGVLVGEDMLSDKASALCKRGASVIACPSAMIMTADEGENRALVAKASSLTLACAYLIANASEDESTTDSIMCAYNIICENGEILACSEPFESKNGDTVSEIDTQLLNSVRMKRAMLTPLEARKIPFELQEKKTALTRKINAYPFLCEGESEMAKMSERILTMQAHALAKRLVASHSACAVLGISGGLDSTLALLVAVRACDYLGWSRDKVYAITMPGLGTTTRTKSNAHRLCESLGVPVTEISICNAVRAHFADIGQDEGNTDVTYENAQARERTQILMDKANMLGGLVVGTGDLSEIALGWSTYNADHMSMYNPNCDAPKTLVRALTEYEATKLGKKSAEILKSILNTPVSPELLPAHNDKITQRTEEKLGSYDLHDFLIYNFVKYGFAPSKLYRLAKIAFEGKMDEKSIYAGIELFIKRFFTQQFKRSCSPDGVKLFSVSLSPRTDLKMPSDAVCALWLDELKTNKNY